MKALNGQYKLGMQFVQFKGLIKFNRDWDWVAIGEILGYLNSNLTLYHVKEQICED